MSTICAFLRVDQLRGLQRGQRRAAGARAHERPYQHRAADERDGNQEQVVDEELHVVAGGLSAKGPVRSCFRLV
jgi:hypothetical protein